MYLYLSQVLIEVANTITKIPVMIATPSVNPFCSYCRNPIASDATAAKIRICNGLLMKLVVINSVRGVHFVSCYLLLPYCLVLAFNSEVYTP